jgi:ABC-2 type transport system ATP-binding protein
VARIAGLDCWDQTLEIKRLAGYVPGEPSLDPNLTGGQILEYFAHLRGGVDHAYLKTLVDRFDLDTSRKFRQYSTGNKRKVVLIQAFMHRPKVLILDEPTSGLDPNQIVEIRSLIKEIGREKTVILSTHILPEVQATCSRILIISGGKLVADGTPDSLRAREKGGRYRVVVESNGVVKEAIRDRLAGLSGVARCEMIAGEEGSHAFALDAAAASDLRKPIFRAAVDNRWTLLELLRESASLEDVFRNLTTGDVVAENEQRQEKGKS